MADRPTGAAGLAGLPQGRPPEPDGDHSPVRLPEAAARPAQQGQEALPGRQVQQEFDFEAPADDDGTAEHRRGSTAPRSNGRLTMRDVILARATPASHTAGPRAGNFSNLLSRPSPGSRSRSPAAGQRRRQGPRQRQVPLRQHPPRGVRRDPGPSIRAPQASELVAARAARRRASCRSSSSATSTPTTRPSSRRDRQAYRC